eukprot:CAMPEP_0173300684 /NCGR_PEP_ID=MMETSP1143-20121109/17362_1 /TAXON_ID=483371 /ORGANISM="non described non described, Strain CCMP2298" /LENGTH=165 /DNA_ID=CAMNT_0014241093 /DNA_START=262 /DNA_END=756 /DNA_ORIENTATION=-
MVRLTYQEVVNVYHEVKRAACGRTIMIMVAYEVDAMASCKMLTQLLRSDHIAYTIRPVLNIEEVLHSYRNFLTEDIKSVFLLNCGALYNMPKLFQLHNNPHLRCYILDNHRPLHLGNIYSPESVVVFDDTYDPDGELSLPSDGADLSGSGSDSDEESQESEDGIE